MAAGALLSACQPAPPQPKAPDQLACADPAAPSRVNFRLARVWGSPQPSPGADMHEDPDTPGATPLAVRRRVAISGREIVDVVPAFGTGGRPVIYVRFTPKGAADIAKVTRATAPGERLALVMDDRLLAAPYLGAPIDSDSLELVVSPVSRETRALAEALDLAAKGCTPARPEPASSPP